MIKEINIIEKHNPLNDELGTKWFVKGFNDMEGYKVDEYKDQYGYNFWEVEVVDGYIVKKDKSMGIDKEIEVKKGTKSLYHERYGKIELKK